MNNFFNSVQSFFYTVTTNDRYATYGNERLPTSSSYHRHTVSGTSGATAPLTSDDGTLYHTPPQEGQRGRGYNSNNPYQYTLQSPSQSHSSLNLASTMPSASLNINRLTYTPGMRSTQIGNGGGIPLQDYADGVPPPPSPSLSWKRIDRWMEIHYPELSDQINDGVTTLDLNELESDLDCTLPLDVRDSFMTHDGQERGGRPTGIVFGIVMLDLESVAEEWGHWRNAATKIANMTKLANQYQEGINTTGPSATVPHVRHEATHFSSTGHLDWLDNQTSIPPGAVQCAYAHPAWIPLISDFLGNNIGVDLAPGPSGRWGQVIIFGREFDCKYVVAPSWASFLMTFADDLENGNHLVDDETEDGDLAFCASNGKIVPYFEVLKSRIQRLHGQTHLLPSPYRVSPGKHIPNQGQTRISPRSSTLVAEPRRSISGSSQKSDQIPISGKNSRVISTLNPNPHIASSLKKSSPTSRSRSSNSSNQRSPISAERKSPSPLKNSFGANDIDNNNLNDAESKKGSQLTLSEEGIESLNYQQNFILKTEFINKQGDEPEPKSNAENIDNNQKAISSNVSTSPIMSEFCESGGEEKNPKFDCVKENDLLVNEMKEVAL